MSNRDSILQPFVDRAWCVGNWGRFVLVDTRWYLDGSSGRDAYNGGHIPAAVFIDLDESLSGPASKETGRNPMPDPEVFAQGMREAGIDGVPACGPEEHGSLRASQPGTGGGVCEFTGSGSMSVELFRSCAGREDLHKRAPTLS